ncbi:hypothetical protein CFOL_v3_24169 [Cephalotus follicularis]|uniref:Uncharacterized protein n=1 Tax=Cephalotus follicularis TaxID=3775 RepID=A0A1Q3CKE3_CEPFO|nr:hypothetical protein CFOL_v3_24169 [Cephalotus follicularis]
MSLALDIEPSRLSCSVFHLTGDLRPEEPVAEREEEEEEECASTTTSSSSIGRNSDDDDVERSGSDGEGNEVQSSYKRPLETMEALEEVLPIRRGISKFYCGKSKSFASLTDASSSTSIKDVGKPENAYTRRRRNLLAFNHVWDKNRNFPHRSSGISKRPLSASRSTLALAVAVSSSESISNTSEDSNSSSHSRSPPTLPPLHPRSSYNNIPPSSSPRRNVCAWRSFSVVDLQQCANNHSSNSEKN